MPADINRSKTVIVLFTMPGCPHCADFKPVFERVAKRYREHVPVVYVDVTRPEVQAFCDQHNIQAVPVMLLLKRGTAHTARAEGGVNGAVVEQFFYTAAIHAH